MAARVAAGAVARVASRTVLRLASEGSKKPHERLLMLTVSVPQTHLRTM